LVLAAGLAGVVGLAGCQSDGPAVSNAPNPALRQLQSPSNATAADADRAALSRLVGVWNFEGWSRGSSGERHEASGTAAASIEHEHFVLFDIRSNVGPLSGRTGGTSGSMLFASEPDKGLTLTAWGYASPAIRRFSGTVHGNGSAFALKETGRGTSMTLTFETDDRWVAEVRDAGSGEQSVIARYTFTRRSN
jgi:hypothetical protein